MIPGSHDNGAQGTRGTAGRKPCRVLLTKRSQDNV